MYSKPEIRFDSIDIERLTSFLDRYEVSATEQLNRIRVGEIKMKQMQYALLQDKLFTLAFVHYALGNSLITVKHYFMETILIYFDVLKLRGPKSFGPRLLIPADEMPNITEMVKKGVFKESNRKDLSLGNSCKSLSMMYLSLAIGAHEMARTIAEYVWEPDNPIYIGPDSEVCTPQKQGLAYVLRDYLLSNPQEAEAELLKVDNPTEETLLLRRILYAIVSSNKKLFLQSLSELLQWHETKITNRQNELRDFICLPALGSVALASYQELIVPSDNIILKNNPYLPIELMTV